MEEREAISIALEALGRWSMENDIILAGQEHKTKGHLETREALRQAMEFIKAEVNAGGGVLSGRTRHIRINFYRPEHGIVLDEQTIHSAVWDLNPKLEKNWFKVTVIE